MIVNVSTGTIMGVVKAPPSKSWMQRICAAALLHHGVTTIKQYGISDDDQAAVRIVQGLGAQVTMSADDIQIKSTGRIKPQSSSISCGESGLSARMFLPIMGLSEKQIKVEGMGSLLGRPMNAILEVLPRLGVSVDSVDSKLPVVLQGPVKPVDVKIDGSMSSQFLTGLLFALSSCAEESLNIYVQELKSIPYIDMSLEVLHRFGRRVRHERYQKFIIDPTASGPQSQIEITVPGDWSSAAYWLVGGAIAGKEIKVTGLATGTYQADELIVSILKLSGADITVGANYIGVKSSPLNPFHAELTDAPDLFPVLAVLAACCNGISSISGVHRLIHKESNRNDSIQSLLRTLDVTYHVADDRLIIEGKTILASGLVNGWGDHRIVMAAAIGALRTSDGLNITDAQAVAKSYPLFFEDAKALGMQCGMMN